MIILAQKDQGELCPVGNNSTFVQDNNHRNISPQLPLISRPLIRRPLSDLM